MFLMLISTLLLTIGLDAQASSSFSELETKITYESNETKIKKMQLALTDFGLYNWEIDWLFDSVERSLLNYQKTTWLIDNDWDYGAWYFWVQTLTSLQEDYPNIFDEITNKYLLMDKPATNIRYFYITAYYSPLPNQERYSYNVYKKRYRTYAEEIVLQWDWKITASWKWVFEWLLAWPRNYAFWTKIEFDWLGVWAIEDRWWAIVNSWERGHDYDRIDVWMWYWDEWLERATKWWKRKVEWKVVPDTRSLTIQFDTSVVAQYSELKVDAENPIKENVEKLQTLLTEVKIYSWIIDWDFNSVKNDLIKYQVDNNIISSSKSEEAGYFWSSTYAALREDYGWDIFKNRDNELDEDVVLSQEVRDNLDLIHDKISTVIDDKYWKNTLRAIKYRKDLRVAIDASLASYFEQKDLISNTHVEELLERINIEIRKSIYYLKEPLYRNKQVSFKSILNDGRMKVIDRNGEIITIDDGESLEWGKVSWFQHR